MVEYNIDLNWVTEGAERFLNQDEGYLKKGQSLYQRYNAICNNIESICEKNGHKDNDSYSSEGIGERFSKYISNNWVSFASPVLGNFGNSSGLPISCNHGVIADNLESIQYQNYEMAMLAKNGAGTAKNFSQIRPKGAPISTGGISDGVMSWIEQYAFTISKVTQSSIRRGFLTAYLRADHAEILDFLRIGTREYKKDNSKEGGKENGSSYEFMNDITTAVTIPKGWMQNLRNGDPLCRKVWAKILKTRSEAGFPYILFEDNCNINSPKVYKDKNVWLHNANICIEAIEYADEEKEFACCLSSVNLLHYDDWKKDENFLIDMSVMLDCVISEYVEKGEKIDGLKRAVKFAKEHRAIGLGVMGFHSYLQKNMISFGSLESHWFNTEVFKAMRRKSQFASQWMAKAWGEPLYMKGTGYRSSSTMAVAPTKSTSFIMGGVSSGIEPLKSNYHEKKLAKIQDTYKNPQLKDFLKRKNKDTLSVWDSILKRNGSVQHLDFLSDHEKEVFKTFPEISQLDILKLAAERQPYIDMGQSLNLMIHPDTPAKEENKLINMAYDLGIKSLYYRYSMSAAQQFANSLLECSSCEG